MRECVKERESGARAGEERESDARASALHVT